MVDGGRGWFIYGLVVSFGMQWLSMVYEWSTMIDYGYGGRLWRQGSWQWSILVYKLSMIIMDGGFATIDFDTI